MKPNLLNLFGLGKFPFSASISALISIALYFLVVFNFSNNRLVNILLFVIILLLAITLVNFNKKYTIKDPKEIVIDEFLGMYLCLIIVNTISFLEVSILFLAFRIVDNLKLWPFSYIERKLDGKFGFLWDDLIIGLALGLVYLLVI